MILPELLLCAALASSPPLSPEATATVRHEIGVRFATDQAVLTPETFARNLDWLLDTSTRIGWPDVQRFGWQTASQATIMLKHASDDPAAILALACILPSMERIYRGSPFGEAYAIALDGYLAAVGASQIYGTQLEAAADGVFETMPVADPCALDRRRGELGMTPLWVYVGEIAEAHGEPAYAGGGT